jgi:hypothetical protein
MVFMPSKPRGTAAASSATAALAPEYARTLAGEIKYQRALALAFHAGNTEAHMAAYLQHSLCKLVRHLGGHGAGALVQAAFDDRIAEEEIAWAAATQSAQQKHAADALEALRHDHKR